MAIETPILKLLLIQEDWQFANDSFNVVIEDMDKKLLGVAHAKSKIHWDGWETGHSYVKGDVVRTERCKSNQYYYCVTSGISDTSEPTNNVSGSIVTDGTVQWKICEIGDSEGSAAVDIFRGGMPYGKGQLVLYNEVLYRCKVAHVAAQTMELDEDKWQQVDASLQPWKKSVYFLENDIVVYDNVIYKCIIAHTSGYNFDYAKWVPLTITLINDWEPETRYIQNQIVLYNGILYRALDTHESDSTSFTNDLSNNHWEDLKANLPEWKANDGYLVGQIVVYNNRLYRCSTAHIATSTFDYTKWESVLASPVVDEWQSSTNYLDGQLVLNAGNLYRANQTHTSDNTSILNDIAKWNLVYANVGMWRSNVNYKSGQLVIYNNKLYKSNVDHLSGSTFDQTKWDSVVSFPVIEVWQPNTSYLANQIVRSNDMLLRAIDTHTSDATSIINDMDMPNNNNHWALVYANIAPWQASVVYEIGSQVIYNNNLYKAKDTHTSGTTFSISHWDLMGRFDAFLYNWQSNKYYYANQVVVVDKELWRNNTTHTSASDWVTDRSNWTKISSETLIEPWESSIEYLVNQVVTKDGILYRCITRHTSGTNFDTSKWEMIYATIAPWRASTPYRTGEYVVYNNQLYRCITVHTSQSTFEPDGLKWQTIANNIAGIPLWVSGTFYYANQVVKHNNKIWRCLVPHTSITKDEQPDIRLVYSMSGTFFLSVNQGTSLPVSATVDLGATYLASDIEVSSGGGYLNVAGILEGSTDNVNFTKISDFAGRENQPGDSISLDSYINVRYLRFTVTYKEPNVTGSLHFSGIKLWGDSSKWEVIVEDSIRLTYWQSGMRYNTNDVVLYDNEFYRCTITHDSDSTFDVTKWRKIPDIVIPDWKASTKYKVNQVVFYNDKLYKCTTAHTSSATFTQSNWTPINDTIEDWSTNTEYYVNQVVWYNNSLWRCKTSHKSSTETPNDNIVYTSTTNIAEVTDTTTIPYEEIIDLGDTYLIESITYDVVATNMSAKYYLEVSEDGVTYTVFDKYESITLAQYIKVVVDSVNIETGATNPDVYLDNFVVKAQYDKWEEFSTMNTLTDEDIDSMFI